VRVLAFRNFFHPDPGCLEGKLGRKGDEMRLSGIVIDRQEIWYYTVLYGSSRDR
jgi:hypothetical protein